MSQRRPFLSQTLNQTRFYLSQTLPSLSTWLCRCPEGEHRAGTHVPNSQQYPSGIWETQETGNHSNHSKSFCFPPRTTRNPHYGLCSAPHEQCVGSVPALGTPWWGRHAAKQGIFMRSPKDLSCLGVFHSTTRGCQQLSF